VTGTFANNDSLRSRDSETGEIIGGAVAASNLAAGAEIDSDTESLLVSSYGYAEFSLDTVTEDAEYELRLDAIRTGEGSDAEVASWWVTAFCEASATTVSRIPRSSFHEQDDPVRASSYKYIKEAQNRTWYENTAIILNDFRRLDAGTLKASGRPEIFFPIGGSQYMDRAQSNLASGLLLKGASAKTLKAKIWISRMDTVDRRMIDITGAAPNSGPPLFAFTGSVPVDDLIVGATSGAVARFDAFESYLFHPSRMFYRRVSGDFQDGETINGTLGSFSATTTLSPAKMEGNPKLRLAVFHENGVPVASKDFDLSGLAAGGVRLVTMTLDLPTSQYDNDHSVISDYPLIWTISTWTEDLSMDCLVLEQYQVFQAPLTTLNAELYEDQQ
jgi:hypothetical protein